MRAEILTKAYFLIVLTRPVNVVIAVLSILLAAFISGAGNLTRTIIFACISGAFVMSGANVINDYFDIDIDRINKPKRPLPANKVHPNLAFKFAILCFALGVLSSLMVNYKAFGLAVFCAVMLYAYSAVFKKTVLLGNILVAIITALAFIYGSLAVNNIAGGVIPAIFAFLMHLGREIVKDIEDMKGDRANNAQTLPVKYGDKGAKWIASLIFLVLILATVIPYLFSIYGEYYFALVMIGVYPILVFSIFCIWFKPSVKNLHRISELLKLDMLIGLCAIYVGSLHLK